MGQAKCFKRNLLQTLNLVNAREFLITIFKTKALSLYQFPELVFIVDISKYMETKVGQNKVSKRLLSSFTGKQSWVVSPNEWLKYKCKYHWEGTCAS